MIRKGSIIGLSDVREIGEKRTKVRTVVVDLEDDSFRGIRALSCRVFGDSVYDLEIDAPVLCEVVDYGMTLKSVILEG